MMRYLALALLLTLPVGPALGDDSPIEAGPHAKKKVQKPKPAPSPRPTPVPTPVPLPPPTPASPLTFDENPTEPESPPLEEKSEEPVPVPERGLTLGFQTWGVAGFSGEAEDRFTYGGRLSADGPVANPWSRPLRMFARLDLTTQPGTTATFTNIEEFARSAEFVGGTYYRLADNRSGGQHITTSFVAWAGFATLRDGEVADRYTRKIGFGIRLAEETSGAEVTVSYCRDEAAGYVGAGQVCVTGSVPLVFTKGIMVMGGDAVLNMSRATVSPQRDIFRLMIGVAVDQVVALVRGND